MTSEPKPTGQNNSSRETAEHGNHQVCVTKFIEDTPAEEDLLAFHRETGPHERIANSISEIIQSAENTGGNMIGLEGGWGVGKTTVINLVKKNLKDDKEITICSFDAWAHEGDPLRRTFLQGLIRHFQSINWIKREIWDEEIEKLAKRRKVTDIRAVPKPTTLGKVFAASLIFVPLGSQLLSASLKGGIRVDFSDSIYWTLVCGITLTLAPGLVLLWNQLRIACKPDPNQKHDNWAFLAGSSVTDTRQEITETPEPTSIEFEDCFRKLMREALPEISKRRAVIVIDNLDRVDTKTALSIWSTLQTFLQYDSTKSETCYRKIWVIVPYDPIGLRQIWDDHKTETVTKDTDSISKSASSSFLDKCFQIRFEVPHPVLSNWKAYFLKLIARALPMHDEKYQHTIFRVYNFCRNKDGGVPTPRELKLYVNQVGAIHRQWQHQFPICHMSYYVVLRRKFADIRKFLVTGSLPDENIASILAPNLLPNLAGMAFNVSASLGQQLLLCDPITTALRENKPETLKELHELHSDGFWAVLELTATTLLSEFEAAAVANAALCLDQAGIVAHQRNETGTIINSLRSRILELEDWSPFDLNIAEGLAAACRLVNDPTATVKLLTNLQGTIIISKGVDKALVIDDKLLKALFHIIEQVRDIGQEMALANEFILPVDASQWIKLCHYIALYDIGLWRFVKPSATFKKISQSLYEIVIKGEISDLHLTAIRVTQSTQIPCDWNELAKALGQRINSLGQSYTKEANILLKVLIQIHNYQCVQAKNLLKDLVVSRRLNGYLQTSESRKDTDFIARCIVVYLWQRPIVTPSTSSSSTYSDYSTFTHWLSMDDAEVAKIIVDILKEEGSLDTLLHVIYPPAWQDLLLKRCISILADSEAPETFFRPILIIEKWRALIDILGKDKLIKLVGLLYKRSSLVEEVQQGSFRYEDAELYLIISNSPESGSFKEWCREGLEALSPDKWQFELANEGNALKLLLSLLEKEGIVVKLKQTD